MAFDGSHYLGEKFQTTRRILSDTALPPSVRAEAHRETLRVLLLQGLGSTPAQRAYAAYLAGSIQPAKGLALTNMAAEQAHSLDRATLLRLANDHGVVHCIGPMEPNLARVDASPYSWTDMVRQSKTSQLWVFEHATARPVKAHTAHRNAGPPPRTPALVLQPSTSRPVLDDNLRQVTAMFCDLVGSTQLLETWGAERYSDMRDSYHAACTGIVARWGGRCDDPQGDDGIMCYFGVPLAYEDSVARALRAGLDILQAVAQLGGQVRLGVVTGHVVVKAGQPIGVSLHLAARLQSIARPGTLVAPARSRCAAQCHQRRPAMVRPRPLRRCPTHPCSGVRRRNRRLQHARRTSGQRFAATAAVGPRRPQFMRTAAAFQPTRG